MTDDTASPAIELAREASFTLGDLKVSPSTREIVQGGLREILEPRVMQVLVALHQASGAVVSRDDLIARCWEGRVVGEDAINRAIGRLRKLYSADGFSGFEIETIPRVGYRLDIPAVHPVSPELPVPPPAAPPPQAPGKASSVDRRVLLGAGAAAVAVLGAGAAYWGFTRKLPSPPQAMDAETRSLLDLAGQAQREGVAEGTARAIGLLEQAARHAPQVAEVWGALALAYAFASHGAPSDVAAMRLRSRAAIARARQIEPHNGLSYEAEGWLFPRRGAWLAAERAFREGLRYHPELDGLLLGLSFVLGGVGRNIDAAEAVRKAVALSPVMDPSLAWNEIQTLWFVGRLVEADESAGRNIALFPRQSSVWFSQLTLLMFTGRAAQARAMLANVDGRPPGIPDWDFDGLALCAQALDTRSAADMAAAMDAQMALAHKGGGYAENAIVFAGAFGELDRAFAIAEALYFGRGFDVGNYRFSKMQGSFSVLEDRRTRPLFAPPTAPMRADPRFGKLVEELGLVRYWRDAGAKPDYQRAG